MERTVVALFEDVNDAQRAVEELLSKGFHSDDISVVRKHEQSGTRTDLTDVGVAAKDVEFYSDGIQRGGTLVAVRTSEFEYGDAMRILHDFSAASMGARLTERPPIGATGTKGNPDPYTSVYARSFEDLEGEFRKDWETRYGSTGGDYARYRPAYEYGWEAYRLFGARTWDAIEPELAEDWLHRHPTEPWADVRDAVRTAWERRKGL